MSIHVSAGQTRPAPNRFRTLAQTSPNLAHTTPFPLVRLALTSPPG